MPYENPYRNAYSDLQRAQLLVVQAGVELDRGLALASKAGATNPEAEVESRRGMVTTCNTVHQLLQELIRLSWSLTGDPGDAPDKR